MNIFAVLEAHVRDAVAALVEAGEIAASPDLSRVAVEPPREENHGDIATNAAMVLAKETGMKPRDLAEKLAVRLRSLPDVASVNVAGPGFINMTLEAAFWPRILSAVLAAAGTFGASTAGQGERVNIEFVSANPTGPMHVGHCRGAVVGDALASLLAFGGYDVAREYYINDAGAQVDILGGSAFLRYREALGETIEIPQGFYPGDYLRPVGAALAQRYGPSLLAMAEREWLPIARDVAVAAMMDLIRADLDLLGVHHDVFFSERSLQHPVDLVGRTIDTLRADGNVYEGRLAPPKGQRDEDWEDREQTLFRATAFGDDVDRPLLKSDGSYTYFASDIAYHKSKFDRGFPMMIDVWGADHGGYVKRMQAAVKATTRGKGELDVKICQLVKLLRGGEPVKMSKRSGDFVTMREVVDEVGRDAVRFMMLMRKNDAPLDFDLVKVIEQSKDNPAFYVQYAHARCRSTFRQAQEIISEGLSTDSLIAAELQLLVDAGEITILKRLAQYPRLIEQAAVAHEPHRVAFYLYELASEFHAHWNRGKDMPHLRFIRDEHGSLTRARLALVRGVEMVLASGLTLLGVSAPDEMR